jgi:2-polyprenyl-3-methyl-5-hydroxy-6-metoxy-1,4-benzoquinol methylase
LSEDKFSWDNAYISGNYKSHWHYSNPSQELATLLASGIVGKGSALDLGCGAGVETMFLAENGLRASGIDVSEKAIELAKFSAKLRRLRIDFRIGTVLDLPYPDKKFVFLNDRGCLHNLDLDEWTSYASEVARIAKPNAYFLLRGASNKESHEQFTCLTEKRLEKYFSDHFAIGAPRHYTMVSDAGTLRSMVAVLRRRSH